MAAPSPLILLSFLLLMAAPITAKGQPPSLAAAIRAATPPGSVAIAVGAENVPLDAGSPPPKSGMPLGQAVAGYGYAAARVGMLFAVAPQSRAALNGAPNRPDFFRDIPPREAFTLLSASLTEGQRNALLGERGLGVGDLATPLQRGLFLTLFPSKRLKIRPRAVPGRPSPVSQERELADPMQAARMRVGTAVRMAVSYTGSEATGLAPVFGSEAGPKIYDAADQSHLFSSAVVDGVAVRSLEPNAPKVGQLSFSLAALQRPVRSDGLRTVGDIVSRIATETKTEMYADRRYEGRPVTIVNAPRTLKASDLLQALCLCLAGAFRRVGPAYVLTDDIAGVGARRQRIADLQADGDALRTAPLKRAEDLLQSSGAFWKTRPGSFGDPLSATPGQMENEDRSSLGSGAISVIRLQFEQLTMPQQKALQQYSAEVARLHDEHPNEGYPLGVDFDKDIELNIEPSVQLLVPGLDGAVDTGLGPFVSEVFRDMSRFRRARDVDSRPAAAVSAGRPMLAEMTRGIPRRALLVNAKTLPHLESAIAVMKQMGLNQLWLSVFSDGVAAIPGTPFSSRDPQAVDLLAQAMKVTAGTGIAVYPVLDLFAWGDAVPGDAEDLTISGHNSVQDSERRFKRALLRAAGSGGPPPSPASRRVTVSPLPASTARDLAALTAAVAARPGVAGIVWRETCPPGYDMPELVRHIEPRGRLGYTESARLDFLRKHHADPIDITPQRAIHPLFELADTTLPGFDDDLMDAVLDRQWNAYCTQANIAVMNSLYATALGALTAPANVASGTKPAGPVVFVRERRDNFGTGWYGAWAGPNTPIPTNHLDFEDAAAPAELKPAPPPNEQARAQTSINLLRLPIGAALDESLLKQQWGDLLKEFSKSALWDGFVFEMAEIR